MVIKHILFVLLLPLALCASWEDRQSFEAAMARALGNKAELVSVAFTNQLARFIQSPDVDARNRATATLVFSLSAMAQFEQTADHTLYQQSRTLATQVSSLGGLGADSWQRLHAELLLAGSYTLDGQYLPAYNILTNALHVIEQTGYEESANEILTAINTCIYEAPDLTLPQLLSRYAGFSAAALGYPAEARTFVADLPLRYRETMEEFIAGVKSFPMGIQEQETVLGQSPSENNIPAKTCVKWVFLVISLLCVLLISVICGMRKKWRKR